MSDNARRYSSLNEVNNNVLFFVNVPVVVALCSFRNRLVDLGL